MSDSVQPQRWQPTRLPCPWDTPGKNTGVGCHFLLQCMKVKSESEVLQSCPTQRSHGLQPTILLRPWDFPGKSTGVGCHCFTDCLKQLFFYLRLQWWSIIDLLSHAFSFYILENEKFKNSGTADIVHVCVLSHSVTSDSSIYGIFQVAISYSGGSFPPRNRIGISCISCVGRGILLPHCHLGSPLYMVRAYFLPSNRLSPHMNFPDWVLL